MVKHAPGSLAELRAYIERRAPFMGGRNEVCSTGIAALDRLLGGGFPRGALTLIVGRAGTGRMSLAATAVLEETRSGRAVAWIDSGTLYPPALALRGVRLDRLLIAHGEGDQAIRAGGHAIDSRTFTVVVLSGIDRALSPARALRLQSSAQAGQITAILVVEPETAAQISLAALKLRLLQQGGGIVVRVEKDRTRAPGQELLWRTVPDDRSALAH